MFYAPDCASLSQGLLVSVPLRGTTVGCLQYRYWMFGDAHIYMEHAISECAAHQPRRGCTSYSVSTIQSNISYSVGFMPILLFCKE